jgi:hypothetical protein
MASTQKSALEKSKRSARKNAWGKFKYGVKQVAASTAISVGIGAAALLVGSTAGEMAYYTSKNGPAIMQHYNDITKKVNSNECNKFNNVHNKEISAALSQWHPVIRNRLGSFLYFNDPENRATAKINILNNTIAVKMENRDVTNDVNHEIGHSIFNHIMKGKDEAKKVALLETCERLIRKNPDAKLYIENGYVLNEKTLSDLVYISSNLNSNSLARMIGLGKTAERIMDNPEKLSSEELQVIKDYTGVMGYIVKMNRNSFDALKSAIDMKIKLLGDYHGKKISYHSFNVFMYVASTSVREAMRQLRTNALVEQKLSMQVMEVAKKHLSGEWESIAMISEKELTTSMAQEREITELLGQRDALFEETIRNEMFANAIMNLLGKIGAEDIEVGLDDDTLQYLSTIEIDGVRILEKAVEGRISCRPEDAKPPYQVKVGPIECYEKPDITKGLWASMKEMIPAFEVPLISWLKNHM